MVASFNGFFSFLQSLLAFIIILVPLVVFHELGHFIFAKSVTSSLRRRCSGIDVFMKSTIRFGDDFSGPLPTR